MGFQDYIGESEACAFAGVSPSTLRRFAEAGYFQIETDSDGLRLFSKSEIENLFGLKPMSGSRPKVGGQPSFTSAASAPSPSPSALFSPAAHSPSPTAVETTQHESTAAVATSTTEMRTTEPERSRAAKTASTVVRATVDEMPLHADHLVSSSPRTNLGESSSFPRGAAVEALEREVTKLQNIVSLQEKLLDVREEEIRSIKGERDWLRSRIEKLEEKNERDQLLLLAETQTVRQLINLQQRKRSTVQLALEWLGLKSPQPAPGQPIEIASTGTRSAHPGGTP